MNELTTGLSYSYSENRSFPPGIGQKTSVGVCAEQSIKARVDEYWAGHLGCTSRELNSVQTRIIPSAEHQGLVAFSTGQGWVVAVPAHWSQELLHTLPAFFPCGQLPRMPALRQLLARRGVPDLYGPAHVFVLPTAPPARLAAAQVRLLQVADLPALHAFEAEMGALAWSLGQGDGWLCAWGAFVEEQLVSLCSVRVWGELLAEICIDTLPTHRRCGYGKAVTSATVQWVQNNTPYLVESVVEVDNESSLALMASLHFQPYGYLLLSETIQV